MTGAAARQSVLVLGGGIAGLQASIDLANLGFYVHLVERTPSIGGRMAQLDKTFPTNDCSMCILAPKMIECAGHDGVTLHTYAELESLEGELGAFRARVRQKSRYVDAQKCTGCGDCAAVCPVLLPNEFEERLSSRTAIHKPFPQAVPNVFAITKKGLAPCRVTCPAEINAQGYVQMIRQGKFDRALAIVHEKMPFAGTIGRICPHPCEGDCTRAEVDEPVSICSLKRAAADFGEHTPTVEATDRDRSRRSRKRVAVVGSGPAGLTAAYNLARKGYPVTVLEKLPVVGGMLRVGVPSYRLPWSVLDREVDIVRRLGVEMRTSSPVRGPGAIRELFDEGFKAVFLAVGAHGSLKLAIPGESLRGVVGAVDLLRRHALGKRPRIGKAVVVIGGGNAAVDAARTAVRLGARKVTILYRRTREEMPALSWEVDAAIEEGVILEQLAAPVRVVGKGGKVAGIEAMRMALGEADDSGRRRPIPVDGSNHLIDCDTVVPAVSQAPVIDFLGPRSRVAVTRLGTLAADPGSMATAQKGVFAGGDAVTGPATAIEAVAAGNRAAESIHRYLQGYPASAREDEAPAARPTTDELEGAEPAQRVAMAHLDLGGRRRTFEEVEQGLTREQAMAEAHRCVNCAACCECMECVSACQASAVDHDLADEVSVLEVGACVVATGFDMMDTRGLEEFGGGKIANVVTGLEFERLLSASGPCEGHVRRPSDGRSPKNIAFIQCVGSRDTRNHAYCSAVCCMHATKEAILANEHEPDVSSTIFYMDLRAAGKNFQSYVERARREYSVTYIRSRPGRLEEVEGSGDVTVIYEDTERRTRERRIFDMVVLCQAMIPSRGALELSAILGVDLDEHGFVKCPSPLLYPVDTTVPGILAIGYASAPRDIPESVIQASAAAGRAAQLLAGRSTDG